MTWKDCFCKRKQFRSGRMVTGHRQGCLCSSLWVCAQKLAGMNGPKFTRQAQVARAALSEDYFPWLVQINRRLPVLILLPSMHSGMPYVLTYIGFLSRLSTNYRTIGGEASQLLHQGLRWWHMAASCAELVSPYRVKYYTILQRIYTGIYYNLNGVTINVNRTSPFTK